MNIEEYRNLVKEKLFAQLEPLGFEAKGDHLILKQDNACLALLRVRDKWSNLAQEVKYLAAVRHDFLPDMEGRDIHGLAENPALYPFKVNPLKLRNLKKGLLKRSVNYRYQSCNLGHYDTANINYGESDPSCTLEEISNQLSSNGVDWLKLLTPSEAARQIRTYGSKDYIEEIWIDSYSQQGY